MTRVILIGLSIQLCGCATLMGAAIGGAVNGREGARRGAMAGANVDLAIAASADDPRPQRDAFEEYDPQTPSQVVYCPYD